MVDEFENNKRVMMKGKRKREYELLEIKEEIEDIVMSEFLEHVIDAEHLLEKIILFHMPLPFHHDGRGMY